MLDAAFEAVPWALPTTLVVAVMSGLAAPRLGARLTVPPVVVWLFLTSIGGFLGVVLTPAGREGISGGFTSHVIRSMAFSLPDVRELRSVNEVSLNIAAAVPLGIGAAIMTYYCARMWPLLTLLLPTICELLQGVFPQLGRVGFLLSDAVNNSIGAIVGCLFGVLAVMPALNVSPWRRRAVADAMTRRRQEHPVGP